MKEIIEQLKEVASSPQVAVAVPTTTAIAGQVTEISNIFGMLSVIVGFVISLVLLRYHWLKTKLLENQLKSQKFDEIE